MNEQTTEVIQVRLTKTQREHLDRLVTKTLRTRSGYLRMLLVRAIQADQAKVKVE